VNRARAVTPFGREPSPALTFFPIFVFDRPAANGLLGTGTEVGDYTVNQEQIAL